MIKSHTSKLYFLQIYTRCTSVWKNNMKINSITNTGYLKGRATESLLTRERKCAKERDSLKQQNNNDQINTTIKSNSDGRVSFKGGAPFIHKAANFAYENPLLAEATFALLITCLARPLTIMATAKTDEDKEKCSYQAMKSVASGVVGLVMTALISTPIKAAVAAAKNKGAFNIPPEMKAKSQEIVKKGVDTLKAAAKTLSGKGENTKLVEQIGKLTANDGLNLSVLTNAGKHAETSFIEEIGKNIPEVTKTVKEAIKEQKVINNYTNTSKNVMEKMFQPIFMPIRAKVTIALVPVLLGLMGQRKPSSKKKQQQQPAEQAIYNIFQNEKEKVLFGSFSGVASNENK